MQSHEERQSREIQRQRLSRVLWAFAVYHPRVRYCQGMNMVAALLLKVRPHRQTVTTHSRHTQRDTCYLLPLPALFYPFHSFSLLHMFS